MIHKMSKKIEKAAAAAAAAAAELAYDSMSDPDIEIEEKTDADISRLCSKNTVSVSFPPPPPPPPPLRLHHFAQ